MSSKFSVEKREEIIKKLRERGVRSPCPRCGNKSFIITDGYFMDVIQTDLNRPALGGKMVPTIVTICDQCGFVSQHSLGVLGFLPESQKEGGEK